MMEMEIIQRSKDRHEKAAFYWNQLANDRVKELNSQLIGLASILLPLTAGIVVVDIPLEAHHKTLLIISWAFLLISIISGLIQIAIDTMYFKNLSDDESMRDYMYSQPNKTVSEIVSEINSLGKTKPSSGHCALLIQGISVFLGLTIVMVVAMLLL